MQNNVKQQWKKRVDVFRYIYSCLNNENNTMNIDSFDETQKSIVDYFLQNKEQIADLIKPLISNKWTWERTKTVDKAIIITAYCENKVALIPKKVAIDQAIINAKNYSEPNSYRFVNAILDKIIA